MLVVVSVEILFSLLLDGTPSLLGIGRERVRMTFVEFVRLTLKVVVPIVSDQVIPVPLVSIKRQRNALTLAPFFTLVFGKCSHVFHAHCMVEWIELQREKTASGPQCPLCRQAWEVVNEAVTKE